MDTSLYDSASKRSENSYGKQELLRDIEESWQLFSQYLDGLMPVQLHEWRDTAGWTVKDHVDHLEAWERAVGELLLGHPFYETLPVDRGLLSADDIDAVNAILRQQQKTSSVDDARTELSKTHNQLVGQIQALSDDDLLRATSDFAATASGEHDEQTLLITIYNNTTDHFREHQIHLENLISN